MIMAGTMRGSVARGAVTMTMMAYMEAWAGTPRCCERLIDRKLRRQCFISLRHLVFHVQDNNLTRSEIEVPSTVIAVNALYRRHSNPLAMSDKSFSTNQHTSCPSDSILKRLLCESRLSNLNVKIPKVGNP